MKERQLLVIKNTRHIKWLPHGLQASVALYILQLLILSIKIILWLCGIKMKGANSKISKQYYFSQTTCRGKCCQLKVLHASKFMA